ncbi:MAG: histidinol-phosphatase [Proteobacteria bacterium]|nr:histidinol-phosphatase [Pseudomonadota bacterium]
MTPPGAPGPLDGFLALAEKLADAAAPIVMESFRRGAVAETKADMSPVTAADREAEAAMRALIEAAYPDHGILGEELGTQNSGAEFVWVLDPIDGTQSYVTGKPLFGTLIALARDGAPVLGVMDNPALGERWVGCEGRPTTFNGEEVSVRPCGELDQAWLYATSPHMFEGDFDAFERLRKRVRRALYGAECIAYGLLANGHVDLVCEATMKPYDYAALVPVVTGAGGVISDWQGEALTLGSDGRVLAAGDGRAHAKALAVLNG